MDLGSFFTNSLTTGQWVLMGLIPPAIFALYFLKMRRQSYLVPSTYLWHRAIEDLNVNSLWQRLRSSLLLFLQILLVLLIILACLRPGWQGVELTGERFIFLVDNSASMGATDLDKNRLEVAKKKVTELIDQMKPGDRGMVISFSDLAHIDQTFTDSRGELKRSLETIELTNRPTDIQEAVKMAAGLTNPGTVREKEGRREFEITEAVPATMYIMSDGNFPEIEELATNYLNEIYVPIGTTNVKNVGILAFNAIQSFEKGGDVELFSRVQNFADETVNTTAALYLNDRLVDASELELTSNERTTLNFGIDANQIDTERTHHLKLVLDYPDNFMLDNTAYAVLNPPNFKRVLLVTPGNEPLTAALGTEAIEKQYLLTVQKPSVLPTAEGAPLSAAQKEYVLSDESGEYDLIIYDQCSPLTLPQANTLFIGSRPPGEEWQFEHVVLPVITDVTDSHPVMNLLTLDNLRIVDANTVTAEMGGQVLIDSVHGPLAQIGPRERFEDLVLGFSITYQEDGRELANTDWPLRYSFPLFIQNSIEYLTGLQREELNFVTRTGQSLLLSPILGESHLIVESPSGKKTELSRLGQGFFLFSNTDEIGIYQRHNPESNKNGWESDQSFAVNLFYENESDLAVQNAITLNHRDLKGKEAYQTTRRELWKWILLAGLAVLVLEWILFNRRL
ncbi:MAG: VWA domain-containing protein [Pirellulaceae bacterium]|nr:VWA domain-containing protein [Pirellulaceae bacterium]